MALDADKITTEELQRKVQAAKRLLAINEAKENLIDFIKFTMPDPEDPEDVGKSMYEVTPQARLLCEVIEKVVAGKLKRVAVSIGPQLGKSEVLTRRTPAWILGKKPSINIMAGTYNQDFANQFGADVRAIIESQPYKQIFPKVALRDKSKDFLSTIHRGKLSFIGVGASGTGKAADLFIVDDPFKNDEEAQSEIIREAVWKWFTSVAFTRIHRRAGVIVVQTRWHEDDLIGRLCDPTHPERNKKYEGIADDWTYIDIPAVITDPDLAKALGLTLSMPTDPRVIREFGRAVQVDPKDPAKVVYKPRPMVALWENRKDLSFLAEARRLDPRVFDALYMGKPTPDEGYYFKKQDIVEYDPADLPRNLEKYAASDHATSEKQENDPTVLGCIGVDHNSHIWVLPDLVWDRMETDRTVEEIIAQMQLHRPNLWWMENELISKSFGPFLRKRMMETQTYTVIDPVTPTKDKRSRARAIQGRMQMRMVHFPRFAPWWKDAKAELLKFPFGAHDDLVDFLSMIGLGLLKELDGRSTTTANDNARPRSGSIEWILAQTKRNAMKSPNGVYKGWRVG